MIYRQLGQSGIRVSVVSLGTMAYGERTPESPDLNLGQRLIHMALDRGVNVIDTADIYAGGESERIVGAAIADRRDRALIATKARMSNQAGPNAGGLSRLHLIRACEASLRRLQTDHIDLYWLHEWDGLTPLDETLEALDALVRSGKVRYAGISNFTARQTMKAITVAAMRGLPRPIGLQLHYSLLSRDAEHDLLPAALAEHLGVLVWSPLAGGLLSGRFRRDRPAPVGFPSPDQWTQPPIRNVDALYDLVERLHEIAECHATTPAAVALAWLRDRPGVSSIVVGGRTEAEVADGLAAADVDVTLAALDELDGLTAPLLPYPHWHQVQFAADRLGPADLAYLRRYLS